jgi:hypothetical protein
MDDTQPLAADTIREQLRHTYDLFADIRRKFDGPGVERGGRVDARQSCRCAILGPVLSLRCVLRCSADARGPASS